MRICPKFMHIAKRLTTRQLRRPDDRETRDSWLDEQDLDLFGMDIGRRGSDLFLGFYSRAGLELALEKYGLFDILRRKGFPDATLAMDVSDPFKHRLTVRERSLNDAPLLCELVVKREWIVADFDYLGALSGQRFETLAIEWLALQNPHKEFCARRPRLPGQERPGLGIARAVLELLVIMSWRLGLAGLVNRPAHYHTAVFFSRHFRYLDPEDEGRLLALRRDLDRFEIQPASWAAEWGCLYEAGDGGEFAWLHDRQIVALDADLKSRFEGEAYREAVREASMRMRFRADVEALKHRAEREGVELAPIRAGH